MPWQNEVKGNASTSHNNSMETMMQEFISSTKTLLHDHSNTIKSQGNLLQTQGALLQSHGSSLRALGNQVGQIAQALQTRPQGSLPSDTKVTRRNGKEEYSALTLRSGTTINKNVKPKGDETTEASPVIRQEETEVQEEAREEEGREEVLTTNPSRGQTADAAARPVSIHETEEVRPLPPFPQRFKKHKEDNQFKRFVDMLDQLHIDVPFLEAIDQMPTYAKFLKDIITKRRKIESVIKARTGTHFPIPEPKNSRNVFKYRYGSQYRNKPGRTCTPTAVPILVANRTCTPTAVPIGVANRTCTPTVVPVRLVQKSQRLVSEEHVPIRLRVHRYDLHQKCRNCIFFIPNGSKTSQRSPTASR
ncbi:hypothetical protein GQ457_12G008690 [Hibiscus cannabinus]